MSVDFSPNKPVGFTTRMMISSAKVNASENVVQPLPPNPKIDVPPLRMFSAMPMMNAPITAPGMLPIPPNTAAMKHFNPGMPPETGVTDA